MVKHNMKLAWKEFNVNLAKIDADLRALEPSYCGNSAGLDLTLHFTDVPSEEVQAEIAAMWDSLTEESEEAVSYKSSAELQADVEAKKQSAAAKLKALGLSDEEVAAILGK